MASRMNEAIVIEDCMVFGAGRRNDFIPTFAQPLP